MGIVLRQRKDALCRHTLGSGVSAQLSDDRGVGSHWERCRRLRRNVLFIMKISNGQMMSTSAEANGVLSINGRVPT
jgi:hypothetical protein